MRTQTQTDKMLASALYDATDPELVEKRRRARRLTQAFNATGPDDGAVRKRLLIELFGSMDRGVWIEPPFYCDYGSHIWLGHHVYMNVNCVILDCNHVRIGDQAQLGPGVIISAATHPIEAQARAAGPELAHPVTIGNKVWIGAGAIIGPGVTIGEETTIGAGSVVVKDVPARVVAAGNPCRVIRSLGD